MSWQPKPAKLKPIVTADGSWTLHHLDFDESYHSCYGAIQESNYVFLGASGAEQRARQGLPTRILEIGFGSGLNFLLTAQAFVRAATKLDYVAYDVWLPPWSAIEPLSLSKGLTTSDRQVWQLLWQKLQAGNLTVNLSNVRLQIILQAAEQATLQQGYDIVYLDAFSPQKCPHLWTASFMQKLAQALAPGGVLVSYCAQGAFRRNLQSVGFVVHKLPGPPGKRQITRAIKA